MNEYTEEQADAIQAAICLMEVAGLSVEHVRMWGMAGAESALVLRACETPQRGVSTAEMEVVDGRVE